MYQRSKYSEKCRLLPITVLLLLCNTSFALGVIAPDTSDGNYTVSYSGCLNLSSGTQYCRLEQRIGTSGSWYVVANYPQTSASFSGKSAGDYYYRAHEYLFVMGGTTYEPEPVYTHNYSQEVRVLVYADNLPVADDLFTQLTTYGYETRVGDLNGDSRLDLFLNRTAGGEAGDGALDEIILVQQTDGSFVATVPTSTQSVTAKQWALAALEILLDDYNLDGFADVLIRKLGTVITGAVDQLLFAPAEILTYSPLGIAPVDSDLQGFLYEIFEWSNDIDYFTNNAVWKQGGYWDWEIECEWIWWGDTWEYYCSYIPTWVIYGYLDFSGFNQQALSFTNEFGNLDDAVDIGIIIGSTKATILKQVLEGLFGSGVFSDIFSDATVNDDTRGVSVLSAVYRLANDSENVGSVGTNWRYLTAGEKTLLLSEGMTLRKVDKVKIFRRKFLLAKLGFGLTDNYLMSPNGHIYIPDSNGTLTWSNDYSAASHSIHEKSLLLHELLHVYQHNNRHCWLPCMIVGSLFSDYDYDIVAGKNYWDYGLEEEAEMFSDRYRMSNNLGVRKSFNAGTTLTDLEGLIPSTLE